MLTVMMTVFSLQVKAQGTITLADGTETSSLIPVYGLYADDDDFHSQFIYPESMLGSLVGSEIQSMTFYFESAPSTPWSGTYAVSVGTTSSASFTTFLPVPTQTVYTGTMAIANNQMTVTFTMPFVYAGGNLLVDFTTVAAGSWSSSSFQGSYVGGASIYDYSYGYGDMVQNFLPKVTLAYSLSTTTCFPISNLTVGNVGPNSVDLTWGSNGDETMWDIYVADNDTDVVDENTIPSDVAYSMDYTLTNLNPSTFYKVYVRSNCGGETSIWMSKTFVTSQIPAYLPYTCDFEDETENANWTIVGSGVNNWVIDTAANNGGSNGLYITNDDGQTNGYNNVSSSTSWAYRDIDFSQSAEYTLSFDCRNEGESTYYDYLKVYIGAPAQIPSSVGAPAGATLIATVAEQAAWQHVNVTFPASYSGVQRIYFLWWNDDSDGDNPAAAVDNITITASDCGTPQNLTLSGRTGSSLEVSFVPALEGDANWQVAIVAANDTLDETLAIDITDTVYEFTNLTPTTTYHIYVRTDCGGEYSNWSNALTATTDCSSESTPYMENFAGFNNGLPQCWGRYQGLASSVFAGSPLVSTTSGWYFTNENVFPLGHPKMNIYSNNQYWLVTPAIDLSSLNEPTLSFELALTDYDNTDPIENIGGQPDDKFMVVISTDNGMTWSAENATVWSNDTTADYSYDNIATMGEEITISLEQYAGQSIKIAFYGESTQSNGDNDLHIYNLRVGERPTCVRPNGLTSINPTTTSVDIRWNGVEDVSAWNVVYGAPGFDTDTVTPIAVMDTTVTLDDLVANTSYEVYVQSDCGGSVSDWTGPLAIMTLPGDPAELPYAHGFSDATENAFWGLVNAGQTNKWYIGTPTGETTPSLFVSQNGTDATYDQTSTSVVWAFRDFTFGDAAEFTLNFRWRGVGEGDYDYMYVYIGTPANVTPGVLSTPAGATQVGQSYFNGQSSWQNASFTFDGSYANSVKRIYFAWRNDGSSGTNPGMMIDSIQITTTNCGAPRALTASNITSEGFDFTFTPAMSSDNTWEYVVTTASSPAAETPELITSNEVTVTGLNPATNYNVFVRTVCADGDNSEWSNAMMVMTNCVNIDELPFTENFDTWTSSSYSPCWSKLNTYQYGQYPYASNSGTYNNSAASLTFYAGTNGTYNMAITPMFDETIAINTLQAEFVYRASSTNDKLIVGVISNPTDFTTFTPVDTVYPGTPASTWAEYEVSFANYEGNGQYIAFLNKNDGSYVYAYIDELSIDLIPTCAKPQQFVVNATTSTSVTLSWTEAGDATAWNIEYGEVGFEQGTGTLESASTNPYTVANLVEGTVYDFYVQADCGGSTSAWRGPIQAAPGSYNMHVTGWDTLTTCGSVIYDNGGVAGNYSNNVDANLVIYPETAGSFVSITGTLIAESSNYDQLIIYDGDDATTPLFVSNQSGSTNVLNFGPFVSTSGPLTIHFHSDGSTTFAGFELHVSCASCAPVANVTASNVTEAQATINWVGTSNSYNVIYGEAGFNPETEGTTVTATANTYTLTGLDNATSYDVYVQADCGGGEFAPMVRVSFVTEACALSNQCTYTFALTDSYGDGWNGAYVTVEQNGVVVATVEAINHQLSNNPTTDNIPVSLCDGVATTIVWHSGNYDDECGLTITDPSGTSLYSQTDMESTFGTLVTFTTNCSGAPVVTCDAPTNVAASNITANGATITWTAGGNETAWNLQYKTASGSWSNSIAVTGTPSYTLSNLTAATAYNVRVQADCGDATSNWAECTFTTANGAGTSCDAPTNLTATGMTVNSVVLNWNQADASVNSWTINYKKSSDNNWTSVTANAHPYTLTGLEYNTVYDVKVAANCDGTTSDYTSVVNFRTAGDGVEDYVLTNSINLYPNPATTTITVQSANGMMNKVEVYDVYGKMLNMVEVNDAQVTMNISNYAAGTYFVRIYTENGMVTKRVVKR